MSGARDILCDTARAVFAGAGDIAPVEEAGFALLLVPEEKDGFGGDWGDLDAVLHIAGVAAPDLPIADLILSGLGDAPTSLIAKAPGVEVVYPWTAGTG